MLRPSQFVKGKVANAPGRYAESANGSIIVPVERRGAVSHDEDVLDMRGQDQRTGFQEPQVKVAVFSHRQAVQQLKLG